MWREWSDGPGWEVGNGGLDTTTAREPDRSSLLPVEKAIVESIEHGANESDGTRRALQLTGLVWSKVMSKVRWWRWCEYASRSFGEEGPCD